MRHTSIRQDLWLTAKESKTLERLINKAQNLADSNKSDLNWLSSQNKIIALLNIYTNQKVRAGELVLRLPEFTTFIRERYEKEAAGLKREANKVNKLKESKQLISSMNRKRSGINNIFKLHAVLNEATLFLIKKLEGIKSYRTFLQSLMDLRLRVKRDSWPVITLVML